MAKRTMKKKKKNPQDATLRNVRAIKNRVSRLEDAVLRLQREMRYIADIVKNPRWS